MMDSFLECLAQGPLLFDGAMGTMLHNQGVSLERCFDELNLTHPDLVADIHRAYIEAGAQIIETNTFGANRFKLSEHGLEDKVAEINRAGVDLARRAVDGQAMIAGSVGPSGRQLAPLGRMRPEAARALFREQVTALAGAGVDLLIFETFSDLDEMGEAVRAARAVCDLPIIAQMTFTEDIRTPLGHTPEQVAEFLRELKVEVIGVNCSVGPALVLRVAMASLSRRNPTPAGRLGLGGA
jgi:methionine synthase I (cobalamin-dependent)